jgi:DNA-binding IclR family transcriptional regulator
MARSDGRKEIAAPNARSKPATGAKAIAASQTVKDEPNDRARRVERAADKPVRRKKASTKRTPTDCQIINSLARGLKVLSAFEPGDETLSNKDLAVRTGLPKPTISRLTNTLVRLNFLAPDGEASGYRLGSATLNLGVTASASIDIPHLARPLMRAFADEYNVSISLGARDGLEVRGLAYSRSNRYASADGENGVHLMLYARQPLGSSAIGFGLLAGMPLPERLPVMGLLAQQIGPAKWPNARRRIEFAIEDIERYGFCASIREWDRTINSVATPITLSASGIPLSLACSEAIGTLSESRIRNIVGPALVELKRQILDTFAKQSAL